MEWLTTGYEKGLFIEGKRIKNIPHFNYLESELHEQGKNRCWNKKNMNKKKDNIDIKLGSMEEKRYWRKK